MISDIADFARVVVETARYPAENPQMTAIVMGIVASLIVLAVLFALYIRIAIKALLAKKKSGRPFLRDYKGSLSRWAARFLGALLLFLALLGEYGARPTVCAGCHSSIYRSFLKSPHKEQGCLSCHQEPGAIGYVIQKIDYLRWLAGDRNEAASVGSVEAFVSSDSCLTCHRSVLSGISKKTAVRVRHADFKRYPCVDCHNSTGHQEGIKVPRSPDMRTCTACHDARRASASCTACHPSEIALTASLTTIKSKRVPFIKVPAPMGTNCRGCHPLDKCVKCHGLEMPHPPDWVPKHARMAFTEKSICWRCHSDSGEKDFRFCNRCHRFPSPHGSDFKWASILGKAAYKQ